ncbi:MAG: AtpZ/AtpI family protein [Elusimicrobiaceae bacterium]|nr:AtpZ/AtpI family protein [Elusimicrobiaceae bacterium]MBT4402760.1 AtpZ/AtpI family protein [Elusimicrobiaceae bacterium]
MDKNEKRKVMLNAFAQSTYLGIQFAILIVAFGYLGYILDGKFDKEPLFMIIFGLIGFVLAFYNIVRNVK